jgi:hypothetical protein
VPAKTFLEVDQQYLEPRKLKSKLLSKNLIRSLGMMEKETSEDSSISKDESASSAKLAENESDSDSSPKKGKAKVSKEAADSSSDGVK